MGNKTEEFKIKFSAQTDFQSFKQLEKAITDIKNAYNSTKQDSPMHAQLERAAQSADKLKIALQSAYNVKLGTYNMDTLNRSLSQSNTNLKKVITDFQQLGSMGDTAVLNLANDLTTVNLQLKKTETIFDKIAENFVKTAGWSIASSAIHGIVGSIQEAYGYVKALDTSLNDIRIVTYKSAEEMDIFAEKANKAAMALGKGTKDYTQGALIYYQQGLSDEEVAARTDVTLKAANVTQQSTAEVSEQLTAVWNGYKVSASEAELYVDKLAAVAAKTASDLEELSTGMSKVASAANTVGVNVDQMNAMLATTISVTKQSPESVGVAYKTILARMTSIAAGEEAEDGATLASYTEKMNNFGINVLDANNHLRDMGEVIEEIGGKWANLSREQQIALAQVMAGTRQYNNLIALFDNWSMYEDALKTSADAAGTLNKQQDIYMQSSAAHLQQLRTAAEGVYDSLLNADTINKIADAITKVLKPIEQIVDNVGGLLGLLKQIIPLITAITSKQIGHQLSGAIHNLQMGRQNRRTIESAFQRVEDFRQNHPEALDSPGVEKLLNSKSALGKRAELLTTTQTQELYDELTKIVNKYVEVNGEAQKYKNVITQLNKEGKNIPIEQSLKDQADAIEKVNQGYKQELDLLQKLDNDFINDKHVQNFVTTNNAMQSFTGNYTGKNPNFWWQNTTLPKVKSSFLNFNTNVKATLASDTEQFFSDMAFGIAGTRSGVKPTMLYKGAQNYKEQLLKTFTEAADRKQTTIDLQPLLKSGKHSPFAINDIVDKISQSMLTVDQNNNTQVINHTVKKYLDFIGKAFSRGIQETGIPLDKKAIDAAVDEYTDKIANELKNAYGSQDIGNVPVVLKPDELMAETEKAITKGYEAAQVAAQKKEFDTQARKEAQIQFDKQVEEFASMQLKNSPLQKIFNSNNNELITMADELVQRYGTDLKAVANATSEVEAKEKLAFADNNVRQGIQAIIDKVKTLENVSAAEVEQLDQLAAGFRTTANAQEASSDEMERFSLDAGKLEASITRISQLASGVGMFSTSVTNFSSSLAKGDADLPSSITSLGFAAGGAASLIGTLWKTFELGVPEIALIMAAITGVSIAIGALTGNIEQQLEIARRSAEEAEKDAEIKRQELNAVNDIYKSYEDLRKQQEEGTISKEELKNSTAELLKSYGKEADALKVLYADYDDLNSIMKENQIIAQNEYIQSARNVYDAKQAVADKITQGPFGNIIDTISQTEFGKAWNSGWETIKGWGESTIGAKDSNARKALSQSRGSSFAFAQELQEIIGGRDLDTLSKDEIEKYYYKLSDLRKEYRQAYLSSTNSDFKLVYEDLEQNISKLNEDTIAALDDAREAKIEYFNSLADQKFLEIDTEQFALDSDTQLSDQAQTFANLRQSLIEEIKEIYGDEKTIQEVQDMVHNFFSKIAETQRLEVTETFIKNLFPDDATQFGVQKMYRDWLSGLDEDSFKFVTNNENVFRFAGNTTDELNEKLEELYPTVTRTKNQLEQLFSQDTFSLEDVESLQGLKEYEDYTTTTFADAYEQGIISAKKYLSEFYEWQIEQEKNVTRNKPELENYISFGDLQTIRGHMNSNAYDDDIAMLKGAETTLLKNTGQSSIQGVLSLTPEEIADYDDYTKTLIEDYRQLSIAMQAYLEEEKMYEEETENINNGLQTQIDLNKVIINQELAEGDKQAKKAQKVIDSAQKEYEKNGTLSVETLRELNALGEDYYECWIDANGEINFHSEKAKQIAIRNAESAVALAKQNVELNEQLIAEMTRDKQAGRLSEADSKRLDDLRAQRNTLLDTLHITEQILAAEEQEDFEAEKEAKYFKGKEYEAPDRSTQLYDDEIKRYQDRIKLLEKEAEFLEGDELLNNIQDRLELEQKINDVYADRIKYNTESYDIAKKELEEYAKAHNILLEYNEDGTLTRKTMEALQAATEADKKSAIDIENAAGQAQADYTGSDSAEQRRLANAVTQASETAEKRNKEAADALKNASIINTVPGENVSDEATILDNRRKSALTEANALYTQLNDKMAKTTLEYKKQDAEIAKIQKDLDSLSPEQQMEKLGVVKTLQDQRKQDLEQDLQDYQNAINEGLKGIDLGEIDISNIKGMTPEEIDVAIDQMERLANTFATTDPEKYAALTAAAEELKKCRDVAKEYQEQADKTKVSQKELAEAMRNSELEGVSNGLSKVERELKKVKAAQSGLKGKELIANLQKQQALMQKQIVLEKQKLAIQSKQIKAQADTLKGLLATNSIQTQIKFNEDGSLANYYEILQAILMEEGLDENIRKLLQEQLEILQKQSAERAKQAATIEDLQTDIEKLAQDIADKTKEATKKAMDEALKRFNAKVDVEVNIEDAWRNLHKLRAELDGLKDNDYFGKANLGLKQFNEYLRENPNSLLAGGSTQILTNHLNEIMGHIDTIQSGGTSSIYGKGREAEEKAFSDLQKYRDELASNVENGLNAIKEIRETYLSAIDAFISKNNELKSSLEQINNLSKNMQETLKLIYGDEAYDKVGKYIAQETKGYKVLLDSARARADMAKRRMASAPNQEAWEKWAAEYKNAMSDVWKYEEELIKSAKAEFENTLNEEKIKAVAAYKAIYDETSKLPLNMRWDLEKENAQEYIDYTNSLYETSKLNRKFNDAINDADTKHAQETLRKVQQEQMGYLDSQIAKNKQLTKYEVDRANAVYELTLRQIALEEAQNNKSTMRLRRDSQGNYRYEYVADQDKINDAMQKFEDAQNKLYNLDKEYTMKYTEMIESKISEYWEKVKEIYENANLSEEEKQAASQELWERYWGETGIITQVRQQAEWGYQNLQQTSADKQSSLLDTVKDHFNVSHDEMKAKAAESLTAVDEKYKETQGVIEEVGGTVEALTEQYYVHNETMQAIVATESQIVDGLNAQIDAIEALLPELEAMADAWKQIAEQALGAIEAELMYREKLKAEEEEEAAKETKQFGADHLVKPNGFVANTNDKGITQKANYYTWTDPTTGDVRTYRYLEGLGGSTPGSVSGTRGYATYNANGSTHGYASGITYGTIWQGDKELVLIDKKKKPSSMATGGYTGEWGTDGKLAVLHEKELVLNAQDTKNILSAVDIMRTIMNGMSNTYGSLAQNRMPSFDAANGTLDQNVHIDAHFPNVQSANEIEEAFNNLINLASQQISSNLK